MRSINCSRRREIDRQVMEELEPSGCDEVTELPIDGTLDLHTFRPGEIKRLIPDYLEACAERRIYNVRIVHGKGTGALMDAIHEFLKTQTIVKTYHFADEDQGGAGITVVELR